MHVEKDEQVIFAVSDRFEIAVARDGLNRVAAGPHVEPHQGLPPLGRQQRFERLRIGVDEDEAEDVTGIGASVEPERSGRHAADWWRSSLQILAELR